MGVERPRSGGSKVLVAWSGAEGPPGGHCPDWGLQSIWEPFQALNRSLRPLPVKQGTAGLRRQCRASSWTVPNKDLTQYWGILDVFLT